MSDLRRGILIVISGPSGAGKGTIVKKLLERNKNFKLSVSATTRKPRAADIEAADYFFYSLESFKDLIANGKLLEYAMVHGNYYGTPVEYVDKMLICGYDVILEIDVQGALSVKQNHLEACSIFIAPPSLAELEARLRERNTEGEEEMIRRLNRGREELLKIAEYDYIVVNKDIEACTETIMSIIKARKYRVKNNLNIIKALLEGKTVND